MKKLLGTFMALLVMTNIIIAQNITISGKVYSTEDKPLSGVVVTAMQKDSSIFGHYVTDDSGLFQFNNITECTLLFNYFGKIEQTIIAHPTDSPLHVVMQDDVQTLNAAVISEAKPLITVTELGALSFCPSDFAKTLPNAYEVLSQIPVAHIEGNNIEIAGSGTAQIIINGKKTKLTQEQIKNILKTISSERVLSMDVYHAAPARFRMNGTVINVNLKRDTSDSLSLSGNIQIASKQAYYNSQNSEIGLTLSGKKFTIDGGYAIEHSSQYFYNQLQSTHSFVDMIYNIRQDTKQRLSGLSNSFFINTLFEFADDNTLEIAYSGDYTSSENSSTSYISGLNNVMSFNNNYRGKPSVNSVSVSWGNDNWEVNINANQYKKTLNQNVNLANDHVLNSLSFQKDNALSASIERSFVVRSFNLVAGAEVSFVKSNNEYQEVKESNTENNFDYSQNEQTYSFYVDCAKRLSPKIMMNASLEFAYEKSVQINRYLQNPTILWDHFQLYPNLKMMFMISPKRMLQVILSTQKSYPSYWSMTAGQTYLSPYSIVVGNPNLTPQTTYDVNVPYTINNNYIIGFVGSITTKSIIQLAHQSTEKLHLTYKDYNLNQSFRAGLFTAVPIQWCSNFDSRINATIFYLNNNGDIEDVSFNRGVITGRLSATNTVSLLKNRKLFFQLSGWYQLPSIQGYYDIPSMASISAVIVWKPTSSWTFTINGDDIFRTHHSSVKVNYQKQNFSWDMYRDYQFVNVTVSYSFNGHKKKSGNVIDTSRYGM